MTSRENDLISLNHVANVQTQRNNFNFAFFKAFVYNFVL